MVRMVVLTLVAVLIVTGYASAVSGGTQVGSTITTTSIPVSGGLFTVDLDFGSVFTGTALWLDIQVRTPLTQATRR